MTRFLPSRVFPPFRGSKFERNVLAFSVAHLAQSLTEGSNGICDRFSCVHPHFFLPQSSSAGGADGADTFEDDIHNGSALIGAQQDCLLRSSFALAFFNLDLLLLLRDLRWLW
jgi:hypothetical protein